MMTLKGIRLGALVLVLMGCGGEDFASSYWHADGGEGGSDASEEVPVPDAAPDSAPEAPVGALEASPETAEDAPEVPDAPDAPEVAEDADAALDTAPEASPDASPDVGSDPAPDACVPATCEQLGFDCGHVGDGCGGSIFCGSCGVGNTCGGGGVPNVCGGCVPKQCEDVPQYCGLLEDGCGNTIDCGPYTRGWDPSCPNGQHKWYCVPEHIYAPPPFPMGCVQDGAPAAYCCLQG